MRVLCKMKVTCTGHDVNKAGIALGAKEYKKGETYELGETLAKCFVTAEYGEICSKPPAKKAKKAPKKSAKKKKKGKKK